MRAAPTSFPDPSSAWSASWSAAVASRSETTVVCRVGDEVMTWPIRYLRARRRQAERVLTRRLAQVEGHVDHYHPLAEEQRALDQQRGLVVQEVLPPASRHELGNHDRDHVRLAEREQVVDVVEERGEERAVRRGQHHQRDPESPLSPLLLELAGALGVELHVHRLRGGGQRLG